MRERRLTVRLGEWAATLVYPAIMFVLLVAAWIAYIRIFDVKTYLLPSPGAVLESAIQAYTTGIIWPHLAYTTLSTVSGYVIGCGLGVVLGALVAESKTFEKFVYPYVVMIQNMPKVALAPLIVVWFGFDIGSKIATVVLICFFPVFINTIAGIRQASNDHLDVLRAASATRMTLFLKVKLPSAAGTIFAGLQIGVTLALIGAIVAEFIASNQGLGVLIQRAAIDLNTPLMLTGVLTLGAMGLAGNAIVVALQKWIVFWERSAYSIERRNESG